MNCNAHQRCVSSTQFTIRSLGGVGHVYFVPAAAAAAVTLELSRCDLSDYNRFSRPHPSLFPMR